jgi:hypothetical protein
VAGAAAFGVFFGVDRAVGPVPLELPVAGAHRLVIVRAPAGALLHDEEAIDGAVAPVLQDELGAVGHRLPGLQGIERFARGVHEFRHLAAGNGRVVLKLVEVVREGYAVRFGQRGRGEEQGCECHSGLRQMRSHGVRRLLVRSTDKIATRRSVD